MSDPGLTQHTRLRRRVKSLSVASRRTARRTNDLAEFAQAAASEAKPVKPRPFLVVARYLGSTAVVNSFVDRPAAAVLESQLRNRYRRTRAVFTVDPAGPITASVSWKLMKRVLADALA